MTQKQINEWKEKYGEVYALPVDDKTAYLKMPKMADFKRAFLMPYLLVAMKKFVLMTNIFYLLEKNFRSFSILTMPKLLTKVQLQ